MMTSSNMAEFEVALLDICIKYRWLPPEEKVKQANKGLLDEIDNFWVSNYFNIKIDSFNKSKFIVVSFFHKPGYPHNAEFAAEAETYIDAFNQVLSKIYAKIAEESNDTTDTRPIEEV